MFSLPPAAPVAYTNNTLVLPPPTRPSGRSRRLTPEVCAVRPSPGSLAALFLLVVVSRADAQPPVVTDAAPAVAKIDFNRDVRPILSNNCFQCHGPDEKVRKAKLRLDTKEGAHAAAIVPGKPDSSELIVRLTATPDDASVMPPVKTGKKVSPREVEILKQWIKEGANYSAHWAYIRPTCPEVPKSKFPGTNPIDAFLFARLEREGLKPYYELTVTKRGGKDSHQIEEAEVKILGGNGYHIPRDVEWTHGCRAGAQTNYHFGDKDEDLPEYAWIKDNSDGRPHGVGEKKPNAFGLYDMHGNVWEWCWDWYNVYYNKSQNNDPINANPGTDRVLRARTECDHPLP